MKAPLFNEILAISQEIANASSTDNEEMRNAGCQKLQKLCATHQNSPKDHPLQWEALADFTEDGDLAIDIYDIALATAKKLDLDQYIASIYLAMAERFNEFEEQEKALEFIELADKAAENIGSEELKTEIKDLLSTLQNSASK